MPLLRTLVTILRATARMGRTMPFAGIERILVVELTRLGDLLVTIPALYALHARFPDASIVLVADSRYTDLARWAAPFITTVAIGTPASVWPFLKGLREVRRQRFDLAMSISPARRNAAFVLASRSPRKVGYLTSRDSLTPYLDRTPVEAFGMRLDREEVYGRDHLEDRPAKVIAALGIPAARRNSTPRIPDHIAENIRARLREQGIPPGTRYVAIQPFSGWTYRTWSAENFSAVASALRTELGLHVVFFAPHHEWGSLQDIQNDSDVKPALLQTETVLEAAALIAGSVLYIGNDSGPLHLATLLGAPAIGLFGPAPPSLTGPSGERTISLYRQVECSPCDQRRCIRPDNSCRGLITPDQVLVAARQLVPHHVAAGG